MSKRFELSIPGFRCFYQQNYPQDLSVSHCHDCYEILYVVDGKGSYKVEGAEFEMRPRTLVVIRPFEYHHVEISEVDPYERFVLNFSADVLSPDVRAMLEKITCEGSGTFYAPEYLPESVVSVFDRFEAAADMPEEARAVCQKLLLAELILFLSLAGSERILHTEDELGARVLRYINDYLVTDISLDHLAKRFFVSKYYLCRSFKKYSGTSIHGYITYKRVMYAKQLIESGETASGAAYRVGFGDYSAFYRAYVKINGVPPTAGQGKEERKEKGDA